MKNVEDIYPLTPIQQGILFHCLEAPGSGIYFDQYTCVLSGPLRVDLLQRAWEHTVRRHPALRTAFVWEGMDEPLQVVRQRVDLSWDLLDWRDVPTDRHDQRFKDYLHENRGVGFDLRKAPLSRFTLAQTGENEHRFIWSFHHLLSDGWSTGLVVREVFGLYDALHRGENPPLDPPTPFRDYIAWIKRQDRSQLEAFWKHTLKGFSTPSNVSARGGPRDRTESSLGCHRREVRLSRSTTAALQTIAREHRLTMSTIAHGMWGLLLSHYTGQQDLVFGTTVSGRPPGLPGVESVVGMLINTLPVRVDVPIDRAVLPWLTDLQNHLLEVRQFEHSPLADLPRYSDLPAGRQLFDNIVVFVNYPSSGDVLRLAGDVTVDQVYYDEHTNYPLAVIPVPPGNTPGDDGCMRLIMIGHPDHFDDADIRRMLGHYRSVLERIADTPDRRVNELPILTDAERERVLVRFNQTETPVREHDHWLDLFDVQIRQNPAAPAVRCGDRTLSYRELNDRSNRVADRLKTLGVAADVLVGISVERSTDMVVGILGVLKAGGAYVPIDPEYPHQRIAFMLKDAGVKVLLTQTHLLEQLPAHEAQTVLLDSDEWETKPHDPPTETSPGTGLGHDITPDQLAYVIYTSGSTGQPRGVLATHKNLLHSTVARWSYYKDPVERFLLLSSLSFDSSVAGVFWTLSQGGTLCIPRHGSHQDPESLSGLIEEQRITHLLGVPSLYQLIVSSGKDKQLDSLTTAIVAGEACATVVVNNHKQALPRTSLHNEYGPTETTVWATVFDCTGEDLGSSAVPIGRPIPGVKIYVLDRFKHPTPIGVAGEIWIGGRGVTRGYLNHPQLTSEKFVADPFSDDPENRLYRTGDRGRWSEDGQLVFLGRDDDQVKVRGYRIELGEIENTLNQHPAVRESVVIAAPGVNGEWSNNGRGSTDTDSLMRRIATLDPDQVGTLLSEIESMTDSQTEALLAIDACNDPRTPRTPQSPRTPTQREAREMITPTDTAETYVKKDRDVEITVRFARDDFIAPPRDAQRRWLLDQAAAELADNLNHLDTVAKRFVPGSDSQLQGYDIHTAALEDHQIMEDWQTPLMRAMAAHVTESHGDVLEIGFGRGVSATFIQELAVRSHTIVEANPHSISNHYEPWRKRYPERDIRIIPGLWQDNVDKLDEYDGIFFHAFPLNEKEFMEYVVNSVTFAQHAFPMASAHLRKGGVFTYLTTEIDSLSRRHQRALFEHFSSLTLSVEPVTVPPDTQDTWWADSMVIVKAVK